MASIFEAIDGGEEVYLWEIENDGANATITAHELTALQGHRILVEIGDQTIMYARHGSVDDVRIFAFSFVGRNGESCFLSDCLTSARRHRALFNDEYENSEYGTVEFTPCVYDDLIAVADTELIMHRQECGSNASEQERRVLADNIIAGTDTLAWLKSDEGRSLRASGQVIF